MKKLALVFGIIHFITFNYAQVVISPEIGVSYFPFTLYGTSIENSSSGVDLLLGINGQFRVSEEIAINMRLSYTDREDFQWTDLCFCPDYLSSEYRQEDLNLDLSVAYYITNVFSVAIGPSMVKKLNTEFVNNNVDGEEVRNFSDAYFGLNTYLGISVKKLLLKLMYTRRFMSDDLIFYPTKGRNRYDFSISYPVFGSNKKGS